MPKFKREKKETEQALAGERELNIDLSASPLY